MGAGTPASTELAGARERIARYLEAFRRDGTRITDNLNFEAAQEPV